MREFSMTIDGQSVVSSAMIDVVNPATGKPFAQVPDCTREQLDVAMESAQKAFEGWKQDLEFRRSIMYRCAEVLESAADDLGRVATMEQGFPIAMGVGGARAAANIFRFYADLEIPRVVVQDDDLAYVEVVERPLGVIAAIKPWNVPIIMAVNTIAPAFRAGCTVVLKPSPYTPAATLLLGDVLREVVPAGTLNVVSGADPLGQWMTEHPIPRGISFTGSIATGKKVNVTAAADLKRVLLELGGNDPAIVLDDVDPVEAANVIFDRAFMNAGQICMAIKRVFVPEQMYETVVAALAEKARSLNVGDGLDEATEMGPINNRPQFERVSQLVSEAIEAGGTAVTGGAPLAGEGYFFAPTIMTGVAEGVRLVDEEQFGPALPVLPYRTVAEAVERANATTYGLGSSVWGNDPERTQAVAEQLEAGTTWINTHAQLNHHAPFLGRKWSGLGQENGPYSVAAYCDTQTIYRARGGAAAYVPGR